MTDRRPRRRHPAADSRRAAAALSSALSLGLVAAMGWPSAAAGTPAASPAASDAVAPTPRRIRVVVRRHHATPVAEPAPLIVRQPAPAAAQAPAPQPSTRSGGS